MAASDDTSDGDAAQNRKVDRQQGAARADASCAGVRACARARAARPLRKPLTNARQALAANVQSELYARLDAAVAATSDGASDAGYDDGGGHDDVNDDDEAGDVPVTALSPATYEFIVHHLWGAVGAAKSTAKHGVELAHVFSPTDAEFERKISFSASDMETIYYVAGSASVTAGRVLTSMTRARATQVGSGNVCEALGQLRQGARHQGVELHVRQP